MPPDFGSPATANYTAPSFTSTLSGLQGLKLQQQQLQSGALSIQGQQAQLPAIQAEAQLATDKAGQQQAVAAQYAKGVSDLGEPLTMPDGKPATSVIAGMYGRMAPLAPEALKSVIDTHTATIGVQSAALALDMNEKEAVRGPLQAVMNSPADPVLLQGARDAYTALGNAHPDMVANGNIAQGNTLLDHVQKAQEQATIAAKSEATPEGRAAQFAKVAHLAGAFSGLLQGGQQVQTQPGQGNVNTGSATVSGTFAPPLAGGGFTGSTTTASGVTPGAQDTVESDAQGNRYIVSRSPSGAIVSTRPVPGTQGTGGAGAGPVNLPANVTTEQRNALAAEVTGQASQAAQAGGIHALNQQIYDLAGQPATTNKYGEVGSALRRNLGFDPLPGSNADDYDTMTKMLAQSNMRTAQAMGVHTDQQSAQVAQASGTQHYSPTALRNVVNVNDAMVKGQQMYATGLANTVQAQGYGAANTFKTNWGNTFDLGAAQYMAAKDSGSASRLAEVKTSLGVNPGSPGYSPAKAQALAAKIKAMHDLIGAQ